MRKNNFYNKIQSPIILNKSINEKTNNCLKNSTHKYKKLNTKLLH